MRTTRRLATLTLAATAALGLAACSTTVHAKGVAAPTTQEQTSEPVEETGQTQTVETEAPETATGTDEELAEPGAGVPGDEGLCQAVVGWFGYVGLSLLATDENGQVEPDDVVPLLQALRDAPQTHQDASADLLDAADDVSAATDQVIDDVRSGGDLITSFSTLEQPVTAFAESCVAHGVQV